MRRLLLTLALTAPAALAQDGVVRKTFKAHAADISTLAFRPGGRHLATAAGTEVKLWDAATGKEVSSFKGHTKSVRALAFSGDGKTLATYGSARDLRTLSADGIGQLVRLWDVDGAKEVAVLKLTAPLEVIALAFGADGKRLAVMGGGWREGKFGTAKALLSTGTEVQVWDVPGRKLLSSPIRTHPTQNLRAAALSPDGKALAAAPDRGLDFGNPIILIDAATGKEIRKLEGHRFAVTGLAFSADGAALASVDEKGYKVAWDVKGGRGRGLGWPWGGLGQRLAACADASTLLVSSGGGDADLVDVASGSLRGILEKPILGGGYLAALAPDGRVAATAAGGEVKLWDVPPCVPRYQAVGHSGRVSAVALSRDGTRMAAADQRKLHLWEVGPGKAPRLLRSIDVRSEPSRLAFSPDGKRVAVTSGANLWVWGADGKPVDFPGSWSRAEALAWVGDDQLRALIPQGEGRGRGWSCQVVAAEAKVRDAIVKTPPGGAKGLLAWATPDGGHVVLGQQGSDAVVLGVAANKEVLRIPAKEGLRPLCLSDDGETLVLADAKGHLRRWSVAGGKELSASRKPAAPPGPRVLGLTADDNALLLQGSTTISVVDLASGEARTRPRVGLPYALSNSYWGARAPGGKLLATVSGGPTPFTTTYELLLWDLSKLPGAKE